MTQPQTPDQPTTPQRTSEDRRIAALNLQTKTAVSTVAESHATGMQISTIAGREDIERIETEIMLPADYQYKIPIRGQKIPGTDEWDNSQFKVGISADGYDYINRVLGCSFFLPEYVHDEHGDRQRNPIHRPDYIYLRLVAVWYTPLGQLVSASEDVEVNFMLTWLDARINSPSAQVLMENGFPKFDPQGNPAISLNAKDELKALKTLSQLRTFGPRYAQTVARVRLLKMATGIRSLPGNSCVNRPITIVGYRDKLTPQARAEKAGATQTALYGTTRPDDIKPLTAGEMAEVGAPDALESGETIDQTLVGAQQGGGEQQQVDMRAPFAPEDLDLGGDQ